MGIKFGSIILTILFLFIAKISFEATIDVPSTAGRSPASVNAANSIDDDYALHMQGPKVKR